MTTPGTVDAKNSGAKIMGIPFWYFMVLFVVIMVGVLSGKAPVNFLTGFVFTLVLGAFLTWLGGLNKYLDMVGGPSLLCLFVPTILYYFHILPESTSELANAFYTDMGYIEFFIAALIAGSLLSMDRKILVKAGSRYAVPLVIGLAGALLLTGAVGALTGYGFKAAIRNIAIPIMGGGIGAGAIPISQVYAGVRRGSGHDSFLSVAGGCAGQSVGHPFCRRFKHARQ